MRIGKKMFPYPTLNRDVILNSFKKSAFALKYELKTTDTLYTLDNVYVEITNEKFRELISQAVVKIALIVECSSTIYRQSFEIGLSKTKIDIPINNLRDKVYVSAYAYATKDFTYLDEDFLDDYSGYSFEIEKYDILGIDDGFHTTINYDSEKDKKVSSIFRIIPSDEITNKVVKYSTNGKLIYIKMPLEEYKIYYNLSQNNNFINVFLAIFAVPALSYYLNRFQAQQLDLESICSENFWFESVINRYKEIKGVSLTDKLFWELDCNEFSQEALNYGTVSSIDDLFAIALNQAMKGGDEDE